jgi:FdrA protein
VATRLLAAARATGKPVVVDFIGYPPPGRELDGVHFATSLRETAEIAHQLTAMHNTAARPRPAASEERFLRGLFSGGTLAYEAMLGLQAVLSPLYSNVPISDAQRLPDPLHSQAHTVLDLGEDVFTVGRLHPMMDNDLRLRRLRQEAADPEVGLILLDLVLGEGAHPDPAADIAPAIAEVKGSHPIEVAAIVIGTDEDPQDLGRQIDMLAAAGATVFRSTDDAISFVSQRLARQPDPIGAPVALDRFIQQPFAAINVGLESFYASLVGQGAAAVQVDWRPPAGGDDRLMAILAKMKK